MFNYYPSKIDTYWKSDPLDKRRFLASYMHYLSLIKLCHKAQENGKTIGWEIKEILDLSANDVSNYYFKLKYLSYYKVSISPKMVKDKESKEYLFNINLEGDELIDIKHKDNVAALYDNICAVIGDYDLYKEEAVLDMGLLVPGKNMFVLNNRDLVQVEEFKDSLVNFLLTEPYKKLEKGSKVIGSLVFK